MKKIIFSFAIVTLLFTGCSKDEIYVPQPPEVVIENLSAVTAVAQGESVTLRANVTSTLPTTISWSVNGQPVEGATGATFVFTSNESGEYIIKLTVENKDGIITDETTIIVYYLIDFESARVLDYLAGPTSYGDNLYDGHPNQYFGYDDPNGLYMMINESWGSYDFWNGGIAISQWNDMTTEGHTNQCSVYYSNATTGKGGYNGSKTFAVVTGCNNVQYGWDSRPEMSFYDNITEVTFDHFWVTNSTYAVLSMMNGDWVAKQFSYVDHDWFKLVIEAFDKNDNPTGAVVEFYLADFRTATSPGIITEWTKVDLTPLGNKVHTIKFDLQSSDTEQYGMNTPAYFCFDNLAVR